MNKNGRPRFAAKVTKPEATCDQQADDRTESHVEQLELFKFKPTNPRSRTRKDPNGYEESAIRECPVPEPTAPQPPVRTLKIEADGDFWKGVVKPKIRIKGL